MRLKGCVKNLFYTLAVCFVFLPSAARAQVTGMRVSSGPARVRIVLDLDAPASFTEAKGQSGIRLEVGTIERNQCENHALSGFSYGHAAPDHGYDDHQRRAQQLDRNSI